MAHVEYREPTPPKFIRDGLNNEDIEGARTRKEKYFETREIMKIEDIDGTKPKKVYVRQSNYDSFNYFDITKTKFTSSRTINPLMPTYQVKDENNNLIQIGEIPGSSPKKMPMRSQGNYF